MVATKKVFRNRVGWGRIFTNHNWIDYDWVAFSNKLLEWGGAFSEYDLRVRNSGIFFRRGSFILVRIWGIKNIK